MYPTSNLLLKIMEPMNTATRRRHALMDPGSLEFDPLAETRRETSPDSTSRFSRSESPQPWTWDSYLSVNTDR